MLKVGKGIWLYGSYWNILKVEKEENQSFFWYKILVSWSNIGPCPLWSKDLHTFLIGRTRKSTSELMV